MSTIAYAPDERDSLAEPGRRGVDRFFGSLHYRDWRLFWMGLMTTQLGEWMDSTAINWLVLVQTNSPFALGMVNFARGFPTVLFAAVGGVVADRVDRRILLIWTQILSMLCTALLAAIATAGDPELWQIYGLVATRGLVWSFNQPARASIIADLVPRQDITNAMALNSATFNSTRMIGPALAGVIIAAGGTAIVLWIYAAGHLATLASLLVMHHRGNAAIRATGSPLQNLKEGFSYMVSERTVLLLLLLATVPFVLGQPYQSMLPVFARDVFDIGPTGLGLLLSATAVGSLFGTFSVAGLTGFRRKGILMTAALIVLGITLIAFTASPSPVLGCGLLFVTGASFQVYATSNMSLVTLVVSPEYRGRVMGIYQMDRGLIPVGSFIAGLLAENAGAPIAVAIMGGSLALIAATVLTFSPRIRALE